MRNCGLEGIVFLLKICLHIMGLLMLFKMNGYIFKSH